MIIFLISVRSIRIFDSIGNGATYISYSKNCAYLSTDLALSILKLTFR